MRNRKGYTRTKLERYDGDVLVCDRHPHLGVTDAGNPGWYWVLHTPSTLIVAIVEGQDASLELIGRLGAVDGLAAATPAQAVKDKALALVRAWGEERRGRKPKRRKVAQADVVNLEPVYAPGVTPSPKVRSADAELAALIGRGMAGAPVTREEFAAASRKANTLAWRELLMAEVDQTLANPDEVPQQPYRLADGTLCTWDGFRAAYKRLIVIGNELQYRAVMLLDAVDRDEVGREFFRAWEEDWIALIREGWQTWGEAVSHYLASPPVRQEQVRQKLGYIGTRERGWGELGKKTFLRHPEIAEASKARRLVRYEREAKRGG